MLVELVVEEETLGAAGTFERGHVDVLAPQVSLIGPHGEAEARAVWAGMAGASDLERFDLGLLPALIRLLVRWRLCFGKRRHRRTCTRRVIGRGGHLNGQVAGGRSDLNHHWLGGRRGEELDERPGGFHDWWSVTIAFQVPRSRFL